jgi:hypothetical protein
MITLNSQTTSINSAGVGATVSVILAGNRANFLSSIPAPSKTAPSQKVAFIPVFVGAGAALAGSAGATVTGAALANIVLNTVAVAGSALAGSYIFVKLKPQAEKAQRLLKAVEKMSPEQRNAVLTNLGVQLEKVKKNIGNAFTDASQGNFAPDWCRNRKSIS